VHCYTCICIHAFKPSIRKGKRATQPTIRSSSETMVLALELHKHLLQTIIIDKQEQKQAAELLLRFESPSRGLKVVQTAGESPGANSL